MHEVVPSAVRNAVSAATITFTANSINFCFFILGSPFFCHGFTRIFTEFYPLSGHQTAQSCLSSCVLSVASGKAERSLLSF